MEVIIWNSLIVMSKTGFYIGFAIIFGLQINSWLTQRYTHTQQWELANRIVVRAGLIGVGANLLLIPVGFLAATGAMAEEGLEGMLDPFMLEMMWQSPVGNAALFRFSGMSLILSLILIPVRLRLDQRVKLLCDTLYIIGLCVLAYSFTLSGHVAEQGVLAKLVLVSHVVVMAWWFGALIPLKSACSNFEADELFKIMQRFGQQASYMVSLLIIAGVYLTYHLTGSVAAIIHSSHGQLLLLKLTLVSIILGLAAYHKLRLVPSLLSESPEAGSGREKLANSISLEAGVAVLILFTTACLTSLVGPAGIS